MYLFFTLFLSNHLENANQGSYEGSTCSSYVKDKK